MDSEHFVNDEGEFFVTDKVRKDYEDNGYVLVRGVLSQEEIGKLRTSFETSEDIQKHAILRDDNEKGKTRLCIWNYAGNDITGVVARSQKIAGTMQSLMGGDEIYHYHSKLMMKDAKTGGKHLWHQDYGYWYQNGCLFPEMGSIFIPVDKCRRENACLQVLKRSHKMGRISHVLAGDQAGAEKERLELAFQKFEKVYVEMDPGDVLYFHCNLLHSSSKNDSDMRRWVMITSVNKRKNNPNKEHHHALYHPLNILPNSAIKECNLLNSTEDKWFMKDDEDSSATSIEKRVQ